jgi:hypothetical protein
MLTKMQRSVAALTAIALMATAVPLPASAATARGKTVEAKAATDGSTDFSSRRVRRGNNNAAAAAMFGMVAGTIATIAVNESRRKRQRDYYRNGYYGGYQGGYYAPQAYYAPQPYYAQPRYAPRAYSYGAPAGYRGYRGISRDENLISPPQPLSSMPNGGQPYTN